jgi:ABC-2 type transport system permease protein
MSMVRPILAVLYREVLKLARQRTRLLASMVRPMIWLLVIGSGFGAVLGGAAGLSYQQFLAPGVLGMTMLFGAMLSALTMVYDKESGVMRMLVIAPFPHYWIVIVKTLSAVVAALLQAAMLLVLLALLGYLRFTSIDLTLLVAGMVLVPFACAGIGMLAAAFTKTLDNFAAVMNFVIFPVFFLSGSLYPITQLPPWLKVVAMLNPYTYGVDLLKHALLGGIEGRFAPEFAVGLDIAVLAGFTLAAVTVACVRFSSETAFDSVIRVLTGKKTG